MVDEGKLSLGRGDALVEHLLVAAQRGVFGREVVDAEQFPQVRQAGATAVRPDLSPLGSREAGHGVILTETAAPGGDGCHTCGPGSVFVPTGRRPRRTPWRYAFLRPSSPPS